MPQPPYIVLDSTPIHGVPVPTSPSGPFTVTVSNLPIGSSVSVHLFFTGSPDPRQLPFGPGSTPVSDQLCGNDPAEEPDGAIAGFPSPFGVSALASWVILRSLGSCAFLTVGLPTESIAGPQRGCHVAHEQDSTGQGAPFTPGTVVRSQPATTLRPAPAASQRPVPTAPLTHPIGGGHLHEASSGVHSHSPITPRRPDAAPGPGSVIASRRSSPRPQPRMEREPLRLVPRASHPAVTRDARRGGDRPSRTGPGTTPMASTTPPNGASHFTHAPSCRT